MIIDNPEEGSIEAHVQAYLNKGTPAEPEDNRNPEGSEDTPEDEDVQDDVEAVDDEGQPEIDDTEDTEEEIETEEPLHTIKINGKEVQVTLEELKAGHMKDRDYREKTAEVAEARKAVEAEKAKIADLSKVREEYLTESKTLQEIIGSFIVPQEKLDELLKSRDTEGYLRAKAHNEKIQQQVTALRTKTDNIQSQISGEQLEEIQNRKNTEREALLTALPELKDDNSQRSLAEYILNIGFSQDDISNTLDHRLFVLAEKARRYDKMIMDGKQKPVHKAPKVLKGNTARKSASEMQDQKLSELKAKAKRTGSIEDHAALYMAKNSKGA